MASLTRDIPVTNPTAEVNTIELSISYWKGRGYRMTARPVKIKHDRGFESRCYDLFSDACKVADLESASRLNRKRLQALFDAAVAAVAARDGAAWDLVQAACQAEGVAV